MCYNLSNFIKAVSVKPTRYIISSRRTAFYLTQNLFHIVYLQISMCLLVRLNKNRTGILKVKTSSFLYVKSVHTSKIYLLT